MDSIVLHMAKAGDSPMSETYSKSNPKPLPNALGLDTVAMMRYVAWDLHTDRDIVVQGRWRTSETLVACPQVTCRAVPGTVVLWSCSSLRQKMFNGVHVSELKSSGLQ